MFRSSKTPYQKLENYKNKKAKSALVKDFTNDSMVPDTKSIDGKKYLLANWLLSKLKDTHDNLVLKKALYTAHRINDLIELEKRDPTRDVFVDTVTFKIRTLEQFCDELFYAIKDDGLPRELTATSSNKWMKSDLSKCIVSFYSSICPENEEKKEKESSLKS